MPLSKIEQIFQVPRSIYMFIKIISKTQSVDLSAQHTQNALTLAFFTTTLRVGEMHQLSIGILHPSESLIFMIATTMHVIPCDMNG